MAKVSIGVPVYNVAEYLPQCLDSILNQTFQDFEVILVDDGSTDNSFEICQEYVAKDSRFRLIHQENKGLAGARNTIIKNVKTEFISWVDSDDWIEENYLKLLVDTQEKTDADMVTMGHKVYQDGTVYIANYAERFGEHQNSEGAIPAEYMIEDLIRFNLMLPGYWGGVDRISIYKGVFCKEGYNHEDISSRHKLYLRANKIIAIPDMMYVYRIRSGSITNGGIHTFEKAKEVLSTFIMVYREIIYLAELANFHVDMYYKAMFDKMSVNEWYAWGLNDEDKDTLGKYIEDCKEKINKFRIQKI
ncbi:glycosyltransferase family 2 protein [Ligilactobacillus salivarius]|uniref:Glycosyl transferase family 2 n=1 Tax=Ligilactobacillus salivarius TaxID=1624 RepID=A0A1Y0F9M8_9LACO|nr:glycosyltransferase family 2 protein [Ligilactobacillus salivarius]ARU20060.1 glycosyl transferase family 2 [Ligilactobacillus salivarius]